MRRIAMSIVLVALIGVSAAAYGATGLLPVSRTEWDSALSDAIAHGHLARRHSCAATVVSRTHAPPRYTEGSAVVHALDVFLYAHCRIYGHWQRVHIGMTDRQVVETAGAPVPWMSAPTFWLYRFRNGPSDALRVDFANARVINLSWGVHG